MNKIVAYDANFSVDKYRGMGKYINNFVAVLNRQFKQEAIGLLRKQKIAAPGNYLSFGFSNYILWEQFSLLKYRKRFGGIIIFPYNTAPLFIKKSSDNILFIHDLIFLNSFTSPSLKQKIGSLYRKFVVPRIANKFHHIITVSEYSKQQICLKLHLKKEQVSVIPNSIKINEEFPLLNPALNEREDFIFHIGGEPDYKNSMAILFAFAALPAELQNQLHIKIIGIRNKNVLNKYIKKTRDLNIMNKVFFLDYQTDEQVAVLYRTAKMFIFPSFEEGFGIPLIESMKYGCPLLCSDRACFPEIAGEAAHYFNPSDIGSLSRSIMEVINNPSLANDKIKIGYQNVLPFSFDQFEINVTEWLRLFFNI
jgi:glycosyltransferase involved in cell wall biosynthesis